MPMDDAAAPGPRRPARRQLAGRSKATLAAAAVALLGIAALVGLTSNSKATTAPPQHAKNFNLAAVGPTSQTISLATFAGRPLLINFFASWCAPCKRETPLLAKFYRAHDGKVAVLGIDVNDENGAALAFMRAQGVRYPVAADPFPMSVTLSYGVSGLPQTFFLNAQHLIVRHVVGDLTSAELASWAATLARHGSR
jgi:thiol-disulfide isomerase/thioredoxin